jgi:hypothetical protein
LLIQKAAAEFADLRTGLIKSLCPLKQSKGRKTRIIGLIGSHDVGTCKELEELMASDLL